MGGTRDSKIIGEKLKKYKIIYTATTEYGAMLGKDFAYKIISKPLDKEDLKKVIEDYKVKLLIDATHPFAVNASRNAIDVCKELGIEYIRFERECEKINHENVIYVKNFEEAFNIAKNFNRIFFMAGIKNLKRAVEVLGDKIIARVLPISVMEALKLLPQQNIVAMYGTFSKGLNRELILNYKCDAIITKESGEFGGFKEKVYGAIEANAKVIIVEKPKLDYPKVFYDIDELVKEVNKIYINSYQSF
ncbi:precorrin-6x reductase [Methanocaldococcus villosus KIN24-T80]|uniref:Precorrin-6x reductase n=1 Tax=Methanocaldococcus villosus KIN24-T80 TaxID=1069083 RepID=N6V051_9EURY|nr:precorrin-6A reductase [Methanocaldococcus villosus]ENN95678.1 precorrin-6x reductase [Methanocaldococcus villosus KIN24-T80]